MACGTCSLGRGESDGLSLFAVGIVPVQGDKKYAFQGEKKYAMQGGEKMHLKEEKICIQRRENMHFKEKKIYISRRKIICISMRKKSAFQGKKNF